MDDLHSHVSGGMCSMPTTSRLKHWIFVKEHHTFQLQRSAGNLRMNSSTGLTGKQALIFLFLYKLNVVVAIEDFQFVGFFIFFLGNYVNVIFVIV